jgi:Pectate lyase superfamily protein
MKRSCWSRGSFAAILLAWPAWVQGAAVVSVTEHGAKGDGKTLDRSAMNRAVEACAAAGGGQVRVPPGRYLTGTVRLRSGITLVLEAGAVLVGTSDLDQYESYPPPESKPGDSNRWHQALVLGLGVENVAIVGPGVIDGNNVPDPQGEEHMRGPHAVLFGDSQNIVLRDIHIRDAANYAVLLERTSHVDVRGVQFTGGWDGVHFRGRKAQPCRDVRIMDCEFSTGDDCIAGAYWADTLIDRCVINSSCNGIRLIGPARNLIVHDCLFYGPGRHEHRTSREKHRTNMLAGLCLQPGAWMATEGLLDDVKISNVVMHDVSTPLHLSVKPGNMVGRVWVDRLTATGVNLAAASIESWAEAPIGRVCVRDVSLDYTGGGAVDPARTELGAPGTEARPLPAWGLYARNVKVLQLENVRLGVAKKDARPALIAEHVGTLDLDALKLPRGAPAPLVLNDVGAVQSPAMSVTLVPARCLDLNVIAMPLAAIATVEAGDQEGLARVELSVDGQAFAEWVWLKAHELSSVSFTKLSVSGMGPHRVRCGEFVFDVAPGKH